jgi:class 3 adenylate cyclase
MCEPVLAERGVIDKFIGDAIMALFGAPLARARTTRCAPCARRS